VYDKKAVRRRRAVLALLLALSLALITGYFGESAGGALHALQRGAQEAFAPIEAGASRVLKPVRDGAGWIGDVVGAKGRNEELSAEVERLRGELARAHTEARNVQELRGFASLARASSFPQDAQPVTARVIVRSPTVWYSSVRIDKGRGDGVRVNDPVITGDGLAGRVSSVTGGTATVTLITDDTSAVSAQIMPDGANGIVRPKVGDPTDLLLDFVQKGRKVRQGATVVTSGFRSSRLESLFPRGIPIGTVKRVERTELEVYQSLHIKPFADLRRMDFVQVLTHRASGQRAEAVAP
jgi:rod shape-determining protein MreC